MYRQFSSAVRQGNAERVIELIGQGADYDPKNTNDNKPLHWAVERGFEDIVKILVEQQANVNCINRDKETPLHWAVSRS